MAQRLKRWETPRKGGRNDKGRGGSARQRQKAKQLKAMRTRLKANGNSSPPSSNPSNPNHAREKSTASPIFFDAFFVAGSAQGQCDGKLAAFSHLRRTLNHSTVLPDDNLIA